MPKKLEKKISQKLDRLSQLLDNIEEVRVIDSNDPDTWDSDALYDLAESLKETLILLEDQPIKGKYDEFGYPLTETGLCSLVDSYQSQEETENYD